MTVSEQRKSDEELVQATLRGSRESFTLLVHRYEHLVFGLCRNMLGNRDDALDAAQDAFIAAFRRLAELRRPTDFKAWLRGIATNACRQRLRALRPAGDFAELEGLAGTTGYADYAIDLNRALARLSHDTRLTVLLFYFEGNSVREIALFLGVAETTVMSRLRNARSQLRQDLKSMFDEPIKRSTLPEDFADRIPIPYDEYPRFADADSYRPMSHWRTKWLLSAFPEGSAIERSAVSGYDWESVQDRAVDVAVRKPDEVIEEVVLRMSGRIDGVKTEAALLPLLAEFGLPVPRVVCGPAVDPDLPGRGLLMAITPPLGRSALAWAVDGGTMAIDRACDIVMEGIDLIASVTAKVESSPVASLIERCTLAEELARVETIGGPWMNHAAFANALKRLGPVVASIDEPLIFSDSGIGPNVRVDDQGNLVGFESFCGARIEDPHYQISKYWTYDCWPIRRAGFVERYLIRRRLSLRDFAPRLGVRALVTLQREIPLRGGDEGYRNDMLGWLKMAVDNL
jgi:RNA polymerase sigma-70 factor (ECF subfamily)